MKPIAALAAVVLLGAAAPSIAPSVQAVTEKLERDGPKRTVDALAAGDGAAWRAVVRGVARADPRWLALSVQLAPGTDAATSEELHAAFSDALAVAPARVLPLAPSAIALDRLCSVPLIEPTPAQVSGYRRAREMALAGVRSPALGAKAAECRRLLAR